MGVELEVWDSNPPDDNCFGHADDSCCWEVKRLIQCSGAGHRFLRLSRDAFHMSPPLCSTHSLETFLDGDFAPSGIPAVVNTRSSFSRSAMSDDTVSIETQTLTFGLEPLCWSFPAGSGEHVSAESVARVPELMGMTALGLGHSTVAGVHVVVVGSDEDACSDAGCCEAVDRYPRVLYAGIGMWTTSTSSDPRTRRSLRDLELRSNSSEKILS